MQFIKNKKSMGKILIILIALAIVITLPKYLEMRRDSKIPGPVSDTIIFKQVVREEALGELKAGNIDYYLSSLDPAQAIEAKNDKDIKLYSAYSEFVSIALNPAPGNGDLLNPFSIQKVRQALNYLIDKKNIIDTVYKGLAVPVVANMVENHPSYKNIKPVIDKYNIKVDKTKAKLLIEEGMQEAGASMVDGKWNFKNKPIILNTFIDNESKDSKNIFEMVSLDLEEVGFKVNKNYYARSDEDFEIPTYTTDPNELKWNFDITGWIYYGAGKYTTFGIPGLYEKKDGWKYENKKIEEVEGEIKNCESQEKWEELNRKLTDLYLNDSVGIWLVAKENMFASKNSLKGLINDEYIGLRFLGNTRQAKNKNNTLTIGSEYLYEAGESWNPVVIESIGMMDIVNTIHDPVKWTDEKLETNPFRWGYAINSAGDINVPADAFTWNVADNKWGNVTADLKVKTAITYNLSSYLGTEWHHGEKINWGDILYFIASTWDRAYDKTKQKISSDRWQDYFDGLKALKISGNELLVYLDISDFDDDYLLQFSGIFQRSAPLEIYASSDKLVFGNNGFEYGEIMDDKLVDLNLTDKEHIAKIFEQLGSINYSEVEPFVSVNEINYFSEKELTNRKKALADWYNLHEHLIISDGPFYIDRYYAETGDITLKAFRSEGYPFTKSTWHIK
ncbi:MAG: ABC transporter substrate-binding protein [Patescibacteria group bacterium]